MTAEERLDRIEHVTAALAEERRKDREEYKALWRDTQRQIDDNARAIVELRILIRESVEKAREADERLELRLAAFAAADEKLGERIGALVSAIGEHVRVGHPRSEA